MKTLKFGLQEFEPVVDTISEDYEQAKKERFTKVKIKLFGDGDNAHTEPVDIEALKSSADSAYDIPLIAELNPYRSNEDFGGHGTLTGSEFSFGFVKESKDNPICFEKDANGKTFITLYGLIWKKYFNNVVEIIKNNGDEVEVSVELDIVKGSMSKRGKPRMKQFVLNGITFLGRITTAACPGAKAELCFSANDNIEFNRDKTNYINSHFSNDIKINNSKEVSVSGKWSNPRLKLLAPILKASNRESLLKEAYLFYKNEGEDTALSDVSYPHHLIKNNELVLHIEGVQAAFSRLAQQHKVEGDAKQHLLRHYRELGLSTENFSEFGLTEEEFSLYFAEDFRKEEDDLDSETQMNERMETEIKEACEATIEEACEATEETEVKEESVTEGCDNSKTFAEEEGCHEENKEEDDKEGEETEEEDAEETEDDKDSEEEMSTNDGIPPESPLATEATVEELLQRIQKLEGENEAYLEKINCMADYEELKNYKAENEKKIAQEAEMLEMTKVLQSMEARGVKMSDTTKEELLNHRNNFANIDAWSNYVKAYAFDNCEKTSEGIISFEMPKSKKNTNNEEYGVWSSLKNKFEN